MSDRVTNINRNWRDEEKLRLGGAQVRDAERGLFSGKTKSDVPVIHIRDGVNLIREFRLGTDIGDEYIDMVIDGYNLLQGVYFYSTEPVPRYCAFEIRTDAGAVETVALGTRKYVLLDGEVSRQSERSWNGDFWLEGAFRLRAYTWNNYQAQPGVKCFLMYEHINKDVSVQ